MPFIIVYGTPPEMSQEKLEKLMKAIHNETNAVTSMQYGLRELMVWFPWDRMMLGLGEEFSIDVVGLEQGSFRDPPGSTDAHTYRQERHSKKIAEKLCDLIATFFPAYVVIQCEVRPFRNHAGGYFVLRAPK